MSDEHPQASITLLPTREREVVEATVAILERLLEKARAGEISEVVVVALSPGGDINAEASPCLSFLQQLGALEFAKACALSDLGND